MSRRNRLLAASAWVLGAAAAVLGQGVADTVHNLSASGPGAVRATTESEICIFCHVPHNAQPQAPLWNRRDPGSTYTTYTSSTLKAAPGQPTGASRLCLSCHDGTIALGEVTSRAAEIAMQGGRMIPDGRTRIGIDLSDDHPVSMSYSAAQGRSAGELLASPSHDGRSLLDPGGAVQCTSCHDPHDDSLGDFLRVDPIDGGMCLKCHNPTGWTQTSHATSTATWSGSGPNPWPGSSFTTVAGNACRNCHTPHRAQGKHRLLKDLQEEDVCLVCHSGAVATYDIAAELAKWTAHDPTATTGDHDPAEVPDGTRGHVECADCHDPHRASASASGTLPGPLQGVNGLDTGGVAVATATYEYEICYKCHADTADSNPDRTPRVHTQPSIRLLFDPGNPSYHPVEAAGKNPDVPSLKQPWTTASIITCTDCHNNDAGRQAGGTGPKGPHGSRWDFLLERRFDSDSFVQNESAAIYALCYKCHDRQSILANESFKEHEKHLKEKVSCNSCHAPHGVDSAQGNATNNSHLINFDTRYVTASGKNGRLEFVDEGRFRGRCSLTCHGEDHDDENY